MITHGFYVIGELSQPLKCNLYVKPGTLKSNISKITGHGSIYQCTAYLDREFPGIPREAHGLNSVEAAKAVMAGDGTLAVVGIIRTLTPSRLDQRGVSVPQAEVLPDEVGRAGVIGE